MKGIKIYVQYVNISKSPIILDNEYSPLIITDQQRITQVLLKLQANAIKFTLQGSIKIIVSIERKAGSKYI